jgi:hypothetical protein
MLRIFITIKSALNAVSKVVSIVVEEVETVSLLCFVIIFEDSIL